MLILVQVHHKLYARGGRNQAKDGVYRKQCQNNASQCRSKLEEVEGDIHRYSLRPLVTLGDVHRGNNGWPPYPRSTRKSTLPGMCESATFQILDLNYPFGAFLIRPLGWFPRRTSTLATTAKHRSRSIKASGMFEDAPLNVRLSQCLIIGEYHFIRS